MNAQQRHQFGSEPVGLAFVGGVAGNKIALQLLHPAKNIGGVTEVFLLLGGQRSLALRRFPQRLRGLSKMVRHAVKNG